nr:MAG TPA: tail assembly protein [Caudoviricetes sp.]
MAKITFHGNLKRFSNEPFELDVSNFRELMSGLITQIQGLRSRLSKGYYKVRIGRKYISNEQLKNNPMIDLDDNSSVHFTPVITGAGKAAGVIQAVVGVVLIAVAWWNPLNWTAGGVMIAGAMGASLAMSGAISLLTRPPDMGSGTNESEKKQSTSFSNLRNLTPQGRPIPLLYGKMMTSLILVSQGIETFDDHQ